jgi:hypothetical protein
MISIDEALLKPRQQRMELMLFENFGLLAQAYCTNFLVIFCWEIVVST